VILVDREAAVGEFGVDAQYDREPNRTHALDFADRGEEANQLFVFELEEFEFDQLAPVVRPADLHTGR
jgi:hypothetical protein